MKTSIIITLAITLFSALGLGGLLRTVNATVSPQRVAVLPKHRAPIQIAEAAGGDGDGETDDDAIEQEESSRLQSLARITPQQAQIVAEKEIGGQISRIKLENEDGNLVYSVLIGDKDVKIDAGNGKVLYLDNPSRESHIQVTESSNGDGDGETNDDG